MDGDSFPMKGNNLVVVRAASPFQLYPYPRTVSDGDVCVDNSGGYTTRSHDNVYAGPLNQREWAERRSRSTNCDCAGSQPLINVPPKGSGDVLLKLSKEENKTLALQSVSSIPRSRVNLDLKSFSTEIVDSNGGNTSLQQNHEDRPTFLHPKEPIDVKQEESETAQNLVDQPKPATNTPETLAEEEEPASKCIEASKSCGPTISSAPDSIEETVSLSVDDEYFDHAVPFTNDIVKVPLVEAETATSLDDPDADLSREFVFLSLCNNGAIQFRNEDGSEICDGLPIGPIGSGDLQKLLEGAVADELFAKCKDKFEVGDGYDSGYDSKMVSPENSFILFTDDGRLLLKTNQLDGSSQIPQLAALCAGGVTNCVETGGPSESKNFGGGQDRKRRRSRSGGNERSSGGDEDNSGGSEEGRDRNRKNGPPRKRKQCPVSRQTNRAYVCPWAAGNPSKGLSCYQKPFHLWHRLRGHIIDVHLKPFKSEICGFRCGKESDLTHHHGSDRHKSAQSTEPKGKCLLNEELIEINLAKAMQQEIQQANTWQKMFRILFPNWLGELPSAYLVDEEPQEIPLSIADIFATGHLVEGLEFQHLLSDSAAQPDTAGNQLQMLQIRVRLLEDHILRTQGQQGLESAIQNPIETMQNTSQDPPQNSQQASPMPWDNSIPSASVSMIRDYMEGPTYRPPNPALMPPPLSNTSSSRNTGASLNEYEPSQDGCLLRKELRYPPTNASDDTMSSSNDGNGITVGGNRRFPKPGAAPGPDMSPSSSYGSSI